MAQLLDQYGRPIDTAALKRVQGAPTVGGVRQPTGPHPSIGLTPQRLARLLRASTDGDPENYLALAEEMEEKDLHYAGVLGTRKRQVSSLEITVDAASDSADDVAAADLVREIVDRDCFADELIDILDAIGKGISATEIIWDTSEDQWRPARLEWRDPRWFTFDPVDGETLLLRDVAGFLPLAPYQWIVHRAKAKSGLSIRGGMARAVCWTFLFKSLTAKDWAIFCEAYGQPMRLGKWGSGASEEEKAELLRAVQSIGSDFAAIVPESMTIELIEAKLTGNLDLYERRCNWLDQQVSKAILGQTQTTDATAGGYATASVHDGVRDDIEKADARQLAATLNRDLAKPLVDLNLGPRRLYPRIRIGRPDEVDIDGLVKNVVQLVPLGLKVGMSTMRDRLGLPDPAPDEELLAPGAISGGAEPPAVDENGDPIAAPTAGQPPALRAAAASAALPDRDAVDTAIDDILGDDGWQAMVAPMIAGLQQKLATATSKEEVAAILAEHLTTMDVSALAEKLAEAAFSAHIAGLAGDDLGRTK